MVTLRVSEFAETDCACGAIVSAGGGEIVSAGGGEIVSAGGGDEVVALLLLLEEETATATPATPSSPSPIHAAVGISLNELLTVDEEDALEAGALVASVATSPDWAYRTGAGELSDEEPPSAALPTPSNCSSTLSSSEDFFFKDNFLEF